MRGYGIYLAHWNSLMVEEFVMEIENNSIIVTRASGQQLRYDSIPAFILDWKVLEEHDREI